MRRDVQLFINNQRVDLFDWEDINIVDTIQDVRDIRKLFVPFSRKFTIPASKNNNKIFKHYYNQNIQNGFDARFKISASIKINGDVYKNGRIVLLGAKLNNDVVYSYDLVFYDGTVDLKTLIGEDMLSDINSTYLNKFTIEYNFINAYRGFVYGWDLVGDVMEFRVFPEDIDDINDPVDLIFPFISTNNYYYYDSSPTGASPIQGDTESRNLNTDIYTTTPYGINYRDLRPAIRLPIIIDAIEEYYGITFTGGFFNEANEEFNRLYLFLQKERGLYESHKETRFTLPDLTSPSPQIEYCPYASDTYGEFSVYYRVAVTINPQQQGDDFTFKVINTLDSKTIFESTGKDQTTFNFNLKATVAEQSKCYRMEFVIGESTSPSFEVDVVVETMRYSFLLDTLEITYQEVIGTDTYNDNGAFTSIEDTFTVTSNVPKMKVIDFLMSIFNMFNLTAYTDLDGNIVVESLDEYYDLGNEVNITRYVDSSDRSVTRNKLYSEISFEFEKASTFAVLNSNEITNDEFGNEKIEDVNNEEYLRDLLAFDGGTYEIKPKFEKIMYERMTDQTANLTTDIGWGWLVDKDQKAVLTKPFLFYAENQVLSIPSYISFDTGFGYQNCDRYYRPANSISKTPLLRQSLNFGSEYDEYYNNLGDNEVSLFNRYWKNYILSIYSKNSRIISLKANLPVTLINSIKLNDTLRIRQNKYRINKLDVNITTGDTKLELVTWKKIIPFYDSDYRADIDIITVDSDLITVDTR